jgi:hypothetical protein
MTVQVAILLGKICCLASYFFLASQGAFYIMAFGKVFTTLPTDYFLQIRKLTEKAIEKPLKVLYPFAILSTLLWITYADKEQTSVFAPLFLSFFMLLADLCLALKISIPLNQRIARLETSYTAEVVILKQRWIRFILIRGYFSVTGFGLLLTYLLLSCQPR